MVPGVASGRRATVARERLARQQGSARGHRPRRRCRRPSQPGKCRAEIPV